MLQPSEKTLDVLHQEILVREGQFGPTMVWFRTHYTEGGTIGAIKVEVADPALLKLTAALQWCCSIEVIDNQDDLDTNEDTYWSRRQMRKPTIYTDVDEFVKDTILAYGDDGRQYPEAHEDEGPSEPPVDWGKE